ncbi:glyoxylase-like metal-dependent hydrolase (beta-lactamase superfamily II)/rhodanese-related sulfurtransferase [Pedobacter sp. CAN_A7]|uniref:MBL fold metallo-hydrolase n=1 Tax=Pedobacter sp. CAN_A7 TaxID=2787722 RepID=UPI0018CB2F91
MKIKQFEDKNLSHYSYAILSETSGEMVLIDPARIPEPYQQYAKAEGASIIGVIETHPHADFVSCHLQLQQQAGVKIYASKLLDPGYSYTAFDEGDVLEFGDVKLTSMNTPGHSPDSISIVLSHDGEDKAVFTGDTLFIGDCGRPDLREMGEDLTLKRDHLARQMYHSLRDKLMHLGDQVVVYPAHGAGSLCGKALSDSSSSTIGNEKLSNWSLQDMSEKAFITALTADQPFVPQYFPYNVALNKSGAPNWRESLSKVLVGETIDNKAAADRLDLQVLVIDTRPAAVYKKQHLKNSINLMDGLKFETWLGTLVAPGDRFYLAAADEDALKQLMERITKIGYEPFLLQAFVLLYGDESSDQLNLEEFEANPSAYTIVDVRNESEREDSPVFEGSIQIPLPALSSRLKEIPTVKPIVVHCAGGYRSAAGSSMLAHRLSPKVFDLSDHINKYIGSH